VAPPEPDERGVPPSALADRLFATVVAPLVLGGPIAPSGAIGPRAAGALHDARLASEGPLVREVTRARLRRARGLAPVDAVPDLAAADWVLAAALHDLLQAANPGFTTPLRRGAARRILKSAIAILESVPAPADAGQALSRHSWLARVLDVRRTDTQVSWWSETRRFLGRAPPARVQAWPALRRVTVIRTRPALLDLAPIAVDRAIWAAAIGSLLMRSPLTDLATCGRKTPAFAWNEAVLALIGEPAGRTLGLRALDRSPPADVDAALGRATRELLSLQSLPPAAAILDVLAERALARVMAGDPPPDPMPPEATAPTRSATDRIFARALGAAVARRSLDQTPSAWPADRLPQWLEALRNASAASPEAERWLNPAR
jgi:hypothetical protein